MDDNIEQFLPEYGNKGKEDHEHENGDGEQSQEASPLPKTADEWVAKMGFVSWPLWLEGQKMRVVSPTSR